MITGILVCFCRPPAARRLSNRPNPDMTTPRALSALAAGSYPDPPYSVSSYYFQDNRVSAFLLFLCKLCTERFFICNINWKFETHM